VKTSAVFLAFLLLPLGTAGAQSVIGESSRPELGTRIRVTDFAKGKPREGVLVEWRADSALARIDATGEYLVVPPALVGQIEVYDGTRSGAGKGALIGGAVGFGGAMLVVVASSGDYYASPSTGEAVAGVVLNTALYAGLGALIGSAVKKPKWRSFGPAPRVQARVDPRGRIGLAVALAY